jgi:transcriptional regulator with XRE-family HTH domain
MALPEREAWTARQLLIPQRLRSRRCELGLTQKQVVTRLGRCGVRTTNRALSGLEHGSGFDVAKLPELAAALDCTVTYLMALTDDPHRWEPDAPIAPPPAFRSAAEACLILGDTVPEHTHRFGTD